MCGIAGVVDLSGQLVDRQLVRQMCEEMVQRGPDANGFYDGEHFSFGHQRLSILDLSPRGNQPMLTQDRELCVVHNGEVYNHLELRDKLKPFGFNFRSKTDTECLLYGYKKWGRKFTTYLRGMWAFAIWDNSANTLFMSRDRFGEKPLYYFQSGTKLAFASSIAGLRPALSETRINTSAVANLLSYQYLPNYECIYEGVQKLPPAHNLVFNRSGLRVESYWELDYRKKLKISLDDAVDRVEELLDSSVAEQLVADVPVGVFLSGGVDSGYVSALAARHKPGIIAITMATPDSKARDESENARKIVEKHGIISIKVPLREDCIKDLPSLLTKMEPFGDSSIMPVSAVSGEAVKHLKVVLTGDGGDEGFGGYGAPRLCYMSYKQRRTSSGRLLKVISPILKLLSRQRLTPLLRYLRLRSNGTKLVTAAGLHPFLEARDSSPGQVRRLLYGEKLKKHLKDPVGAYLVGASETTNAESMWDKMFHIGVKTQLVDDFLYKVDSASMFHSLETRTPYLDYRLVEFTAQLPEDVLLDDSEYKGLLKKAAVRLNPREVVYGRKKGFSIPVEKYFLQGWGKLLLELTMNGVAAQMGLLNPSGIKRYLGKHGLRESKRLDRQLFTILSLEMWLRVFHEKSEQPEELAERMLFYLRNQG